MKPAALKKFSTSHASPLPPSDPGLPKRSVPGPTSLIHFVDLLFFSIFRRSMFINPTIKAGIYLGLAGLVSLIFDFIKPPLTYFGHKNNLFNIYFVKLGWGWTVCSLASFLIVSSFIYTGGNVKLMSAHIIRLVVGSGCWYTMTGFINLIHDLTGHCHPSSLVIKNAIRPSNRMSCQRNGGIWFGFDISGHCFLLVMSNLWILEELKCMHYWSKLGEIIGTETFNSKANNNAHGLSQDELKTIRSAYCRLSSTARIIFNFVACLSMLWDIMFLATVVYFHTMPSKFLGTIFGVCCWFIFYRVIFPRTSVGTWFRLAPGLPGDGPIKFVPK